MKPCPISGLKESTLSSSKAHRDSRQFRNVMPTNFKAPDKSHANPAGFHTWRRRRVCLLEAYRVEMRESEC
jgi:hypothetical protein